MNALYLDLARHTTGVYAGTIDCGVRKGYDSPGMYNVVGGDVSIFGGDGTKESCIQQAAPGHSVGKQWQCLPSSESVLEGLGIDDSYIRFSDFVL